MINFGERRLIVLPKLFAVRNEATVELERPVLSKPAHRYSRIVLDHEIAVIEQEIADSGEPFAVHEIGGGLNQTNARSPRGAPAQKPAVAAGKISPEVKQCLGTAIATKGDSNAFRRTVDVSRVENGATEPRQKNL